MQHRTMILAAAGAVAIFGATASLARAESSIDVHNSWWDQVEKAQSCAMQPGNPYAYSIQSPCASAPPAAYADARRAYPGYYGYGNPYPSYVYGYGRPYAAYLYGYYGWR